MIFEIAAKELIESKSGKFLIDELLASDTELLWGSKCQGFTVRYLHPVAHTVFTGTLQVST